MNSGAWQSPFLSHTPKIFSLICFAFPEQGLEPSRTRRTICYINKQTPEFPLRLDLILSIANQLVRVL